MAAKKRLGELILDQNLITETELNKALKLQVGGTRRLGYILIKMGFISEGQLQTILSDQLDLPIIDVATEFNPAIKKELPRYLCQRYSVIPLNTGENNTLKLAMVDPSDFEAVSDIEKYTGKIIQPVLASKSDITSNIRSKIPWSIHDVFNSQTSPYLTSGISIVALILITVIATQFYHEHQRNLYGEVKHSPKHTSYTHLELVLEFDAKNNISLSGRGAHAPGHYSVIFNDIHSMDTFLKAKKDNFSDRQLEWLNWAKNNPKG